MNEPKLYRRLEPIVASTPRPLEVEAMQWDGTFDSAERIVEWVIENDGEAEYKWDDECESYWIEVLTPGGVREVRPWNFISRQAPRAFLVSKAHAWTLWYEEVPQKTEGTQALLEAADYIDGIYLDLAEYITPVLKYPTIAMKIHRGRTVLGDAAFQLRKMAEESGQP